MRRGSLYTVLSGSGAMCLASACPASVLVLPFVARFWNHVTDEEDSLLKNTTLDKANKAITTVLVRKGCDELEKKGYEVKDEDRAAINESFCSLAEGNFNLDPVKDRLKERAVTELHAKIRSMAIESLKPIARFALEKSAEASKIIAEEAVKESTRWTMKKVLQVPCGAVPCAGIAYCFTELTGGVVLASLAVPLITQAGSMVYNWTQVYGRRQQEESQRVKITSLLEGQMIKHAKGGFDKLFSVYQVENEMKEKAEDTARAVAKPLAANLAEYLMRNKDGDFCSVLIKCLDQK